MSTAHKVTREAASYQPHQNSLSARVINYFRRLTDEELSSRDIAQKYDVDAAGVPSALKAAVAADILKRDGSIYSAGPNIGSLTTDSCTAQVNYARPAQTSRIAFDAATVVIEENVPFVLAARGGRDKWGPLLDRLTCVGQSFCLPIDLRGAIGAAVAKKHKKGATRFKRATISTTEIRVWRVL